MKVNGLRRLEVRLPPDHPVFRFPPGKRSERVRELIDLGLRLEERLSSIERKLDALLSGAAPGGVPPARRRDEGEDLKGKIGSMISSLSL